MWELDCEEGWAPENWCFWTVVLEKTLESPLGCKEIQPVHSKGDQPWDFFGRNDAEAETPVLWPPHAKSWLIVKDSDAGRDWGQEEKGTTEGEMAGWHRWLDEHESQWTPGVGDGQGGLVCCDSWGRKESDTTERLIWSDLMGPDAMILIFKRGVLSQLSHFPLSLSSRGSLFPLQFAIRVVSSAYMRLLIFLLAILILTCDSSSLAFHMMYSACKLNKPQEENWSNGSKGSWETGRWNSDDV